MVGIAGAMALASSAAAQSQSSATTTKTTIQQDFEAATALQDQPAAALAAWEKLERRTGNKRTRAIIAVRKGVALLGVGRVEEAFAATRAGLADLPASDATLAEDRSIAELNLGRIAASTLDYAGAATFYAAAEKSSVSPDQKLAAQLGLATTAVFVDPEAALAALDRADTAMSTVTVDNDARARFRQARARALMNRGDFVAAKREAMAAVKLLGGLTLKTNTADVSARSDVAVAALLAGDKDAARQYMAYTGAGRLPKGSFDPAVQMPVPDCGGEAGLDPADMAVIEFTIEDDGTVDQVTPVYAAGGGQVALEFARAARNWSWTPEQVATLPTFFRSRARVEMRCSTAFQRPAVTVLLDAELDQWLAAKGIAVPADETVADSRRVAGQRARLAAAEAAGGRDALALLPLLHDLVRNSVVGREETGVLAARALAIAAANGAPPAARLSLDLQARAGATADAQERDDLRRSYAALLATPAYAGDPVSRAAIRLLAADLERPRSADRARLLLRQAADDQALAGHQPVRVGALVRLASLEQEKGNAEAARAAFERTGLAANQCSIIDAPPRVVSVGGTFPAEAMAWGFEGWVETQFDIAADGKVLHERAVLSYPPFVFSDAGRRTMAGARYAKTYRPGGELGCGGSKARVRFALGG